MKFQNLKLFKNQIDEKTKLFLIVGLSFFEREQLFNFILNKLDLKTYSISRFISGCKVENIIGSFQNISFFSKKNLAIVEDISFFKKEESSKLFDFLKSNDIHILLGAEKKDTILYPFIEKSGAILDLFSEKIWEKEKRYSDFIFDKVSQSNKTITSVVIQSLIERAGLDLAAIEKELEKLLIFCIDKKSIELEDIEKISITNLQQSVWQIAEKMVWDVIDFEDLYIDTTFFITLIAALRFQLQLGYKIFSIIENKKQDQLIKYFPKIYPRTLDKKKELSLLYGKNFFKNGLEVIFEIDLLSKNSGFDLPYLLDILKTKLFYLKNYEFDTTSKSSK